MDKKGESAVKVVLGGITIIIALIVLGLISTSFAKSQANLMSDMNISSTEYEIANKTLQGQKQVSDNMSTLYLIGIICIILGLVFSAIIGLLIKYR